MKETFYVELEGSPLEIIAKKAAIQAILSISADDRKRVVQVLKNSKALAALKQYWETLLKFA